ncbi:hypothetical protein N7517_001118 [Penicillium concentricum]|uniref:Uncharacterized protein n=1 Tax=Penicillium concentricum TaxID=293559 RepID=A0A9W9SRH2_9EURO|nr:uncharacterized protein N7517_001118 [Penicillium concentricum]KAJ5383207.1 hypothetical protein N7517_001118 [Penicillium concentricum]
MDMDDQATDPVPLPYLSLFRDRHNYQAFGTTSRFDSTLGLARACTYGDLSHNASVHLNGVLASGSVTFCWVPHFFGAFEHSQSLETFIGLGSKVLLLDPNIVRCQAMPTMCRERIPPFLACVHPERRTHSPRSSIAYGLSIDGEELLSLRFTIHYEILMKDYPANLSKVAKVFLMKVPGGCYNIITSILVFIMRDAVAQSQYTLKNYFKRMSPWRMSLCFSHHMNVRHLNIHAYSVGEKLGRLIDMAVWRVNYF